MNISSNITIGADPELFLQNPNDGGFVSAHEYVKGSKKEPYKVVCGAIQLDGTAAEFNIDPARTVNEFVSNIRVVRDQLEHMIRGTGYKLSASPVADFDPAYFDQSIPASCKILGCDPDYNPWELCPNPKPDQKLPFRTGAGHVHIGWGHGFDCNDADHFMLCAEVAKQLDYYLGIYSLLWDPEPRRRQLYGQAGAFRPKTYGMEYRVLSNAWLKSELLQRWVFNSCQKAMTAIDRGDRAEDRWKDAAQTIINENITEWYLMNDAPELEDIPFPPGIQLKKAA